MKCLFAQTSVLAVSVLLFCPSARLSAQPAPYPVPTPYPSPYPGYGYGGGFGPGNVLQGTASVMDAQGNLMLQQEQARIEREKANQAKLDTKRKTLDWQNYEREHKWTLTQEQERTEAMRIQRLLKNPRQEEVLSGSAMNTLLPYLNQLAQQGIQGAPVFLNPYELKQINVTGAGSGQNIGVLSDPGKMDWPLALRGPAQKTLNDQIVKVIGDTLKGTLDYAEYTQVQKGVDALQNDAKTKWNAEQIDSGMYLDCKRFLESVRNGLAVLPQPDAAKYFNGGYAAQGNTVAELASNMSRQGLRFAPALPGEESAYFGLYSSFLDYAAGGQGASGFRVRLAPAIAAPATRQ